MEEAKGERVVIALDEELLEQMNRLKLEKEASTRKEAWEKEAWEKEALAGVLAGSLLVDGTMLEFHRESLLEDKVSIMIPNTFAEMDPEMAALKYPSGHRPNPFSVMTPVRLPYLQIPLYGYFYPKLKKTNQLP